MFIKQDESSTQQPLQARTHKNENARQHSTPLKRNLDILRNAPRRRNSQALKSSPLSSQWSPSQRQTRHHHTRETQPVFGPGLTGLGNSCYMASVLQTRFSLPAFQERYYVVTKNHGMACDEQLPADCVGCQMHKVADGLLSGRYSHPANYATEKPENDDAPVFQAGIKPTGFKALIGKGHEEFSTMRQQDSEEFLTHLLTVLRRDAHKHKERADPGMHSVLSVPNTNSFADATAVFSYSMEQRLQCGECKKVRYSVDSMDVVSVPLPVKEMGKDAEGKTRYEEVPLWDCLGILLVEALEYSCPSSTKSVHALRWRGLNLLLRRSLADMRHILYYYDLVFMGCYPLHILFTDVALHSGSNFLIWTGGSGGNSRRP
ncbi:cysteine proteinase [Hymenopellis radicata]|nr:cysteine proteinase [Hymenopellis radicata]